MYFCQEDLSEKLHCPAESRRNTMGAGYKTTSDLLMDFSRTGCLPKTMDLSRLDDGNGIEAAFIQHKAKWHDSCTQLHRAQKRKRPTEDLGSVCKKFTRQSLGEASASYETCFFCDKQAHAGKSLSKASTFGIDVNVRQCALKLEDKRLLAKLSAGDLIAQDTQYHPQCLVSLYNRARETKLSEKTDADAINHGIALAELVSYIEDVSLDNLVAPVFKLTDLANLYGTRLLQQLGTKVEGRIHSTDLKNRILGYFPDMKALKQGRDTVLVSDADVGSAIRKACEHDADNDAAHLARAANIVRRDMFKMVKKFKRFF